MCASIGLTARQGVLNMFTDMDGAQSFRVVLPLDSDEAESDALIEREMQRDPDIWVVDIEDARGTTFSGRAHRRRVGLMNEFIALVSEVWADSSFGVSPAELLTALGVFLTFAVSAGLCLPVLYWAV